MLDKPILKKEAVIFIVGLVVNININMETHFFHQDNV